MKYPNNCFSIKYIDDHDEIKYLGGQDEKFPGENHHGFPIAISSDIPGWIIRIFPSEILGRIYFKTQI